MDHKDFIKPEQIYDLVAEPKEICPTGVHKEYYAIVFANSTGYIDILMERFKFLQLLRTLNVSALTQNNTALKRSFVNLEQELALSRPTNTTGCVIHGAICFSLSSCLLTTYSNPLLNYFYTIHQRIKSIPTISVPNFVSFKSNSLRNPQTFKIDEAYCKWYGNCFVMDHNSAIYNSANIVKKGLDQLRNHTSNGLATAVVKIQKYAKPCNALIIACNTIGNCAAIPDFEIVLRMVSLGKILKNAYKSSNVLTELVKYEPDFQKMHLRNVTSCMPINLYIDATGYVEVKTEADLTFLPSYFNIIYSFARKQENEVFGELYSKALQRTSNSSEEPFSVIMKLKNKLLSGNMSAIFRTIMENERYIVGMEDLVLSSKHSIHRNSTEAKVIKFRFNTDDNPLPHGESNMAKSISKRDVQSSSANQLEDVKGNNNSVHQRTADNEPNADKSDEFFVPHPLCGVIFVFSFILIVLFFCCCKNSIAEPITANPSGN